MRSTADGPGAGEHLDGGPHGRFELEDGRGRRVGGVDGLLVADEGETEDSAGDGEALLEGGDVEPQVVAVEVAVSMFVGEVVHLIGGRLGGVAEDELPVAAAPGEVSALAVVGGALANLCGVGGAGGGEPAGQARVGGRAQVVAVGDAQVLVAPLHQGFEQP